MELPREAAARQSINNLEIMVIIEIDKDKSTIVYYPGAAFVLIALSTHN